MRVPLAVWLHGREWEWREAQLLAAEETYLNRPETALKEPPMIYTTPVARPGTVRRLLAHPDTRYTLATLGALLLLGCAGALDQERLTLHLLLTLLPVLLLAAALLVGAFGLRPAELEIL